MTTNRNYQRTINVSATPKQAYQALTSGFKDWWTTPDNHFTKPGDSATFRFSEKNGYWTFKATRLEPEYIELVCTEALHLQENMPKAIEKEWLNTTLHWHIIPTDSGCQIHFEHRGLTPQLHCYDICKGGWDMFFVDSLQAYLNTGIGKPFGLIA
jgi:uncharacterized protein YndB with AHSA1/START domain